ncbi:uncharacterized protein EKO05_0002438 [Ascochyta rabiei]|uniref:uncharacterized protein n=1 Tax=Didymella rabiei TaxID=5454 RepID=UPI0021FA04A3|nr:uncharacterized protein EKO05_0002438 [Ascochyta rabiei]UPX11854.1 hypothetical protein EKO05_0002438 [Ascochyta rabiei]
MTVSSSAAEPRICARAGCRPRRPHRMRLLPASSWPVYYLRGSYRPAARLVRQLPLWQ